MKYLAIILVLILASCKSDTKSNKEIDNSVTEMWSNYTKANSGLINNNIPESWYFHNNKKDANRLADLTLSGKKKAASGLYFMYKEATSDLPKIGTKHIITDFDGKAKAIIEIKKVDTIPFNQISKDYAINDMGTTIEPLKKWRKAHWDYFASVMEKSGMQPTDDLLVVCESFETIWPVKH